MINDASRKKKEEKVGSQEDINNFLHMQLLRKEDLIFNKLEWVPTSLANHEILKTSTNTNDKVKLDTTYSPAESPCSEPLPVLWTKVDLIFGKYD